MTGLEEPDRLQAAARRRSESPQARHHARADAARLGAEGGSADRPDQHDRLLQDESVIVRRRAPRRRLNEPRPARRRRPNERRRAPRSCTARRGDRSRRPGDRRTRSSDRHSPGSAAASIPIGRYGGHWTGAPRGFGSPVSMNRRQNVLIVSNTTRSADVRTWFDGAPKLLPKRMFVSRPWNARPGVTAFTAYSNE